MSNPHLTVEEAAALASVHPETIRRAARAGDLSARRAYVGRRHRLLYSRAEVTRWAKRRATPTPVERADG